MKTNNFQVIVTESFERNLKKLRIKYPSIKMEIDELENKLANNPLLGIPLGQNFYKIRIPIKSKGKGKRGGGRVITYAMVSKEKVFLLTIYDKGDK